MVNIVKDNDTHKQKLKESLSPRIRDLLFNLRNWPSHTTVKIVSTSWYPITAAQWQEYLYHVSLELGLGFRKSEILAVDDPGPGLSADKGAKIREDNRGTKEFLDNALFADDSTGNIKSAIMVCNTLYISKRKGLDNHDMNYIIQATNWTRKASTTWTEQF